jgi:hypothetical protein
MVTASMPWTRMATEACATLFEVVRILLSCEQPLMLVKSHTLLVLSAGHLKSVSSAGLKVLSGAWLRLHRSPFSDSSGY